MFVSSPYAGLSKDLLEQVKFHRAKAGTNDIASVMLNTLPIFEPDTIVCHVPTASRRVRIRGYDQSYLIAKKLAKELNLDYRPLIIRTGSTRQVGASRSQRFKQAQISYELNPRQELVGKKILVIDDVTTSGATIEAITHILKNAGAKEVNAAVFAQAIY